MKYPAMTTLFKKLPQLIFLGFISIAFLAMPAQAQETNTKPAETKPSDSAPLAEEVSLTATEKDEAELLAQLAEINTHLDEITEIDKTIKTAKGENLNTAIILRKDKSEALLTELKLFAKIARGYSGTNEELKALFKSEEKKLRRTGAYMRKEIDLYVSRLEKHSIERNTLNQEGLKSYLKDSNLIDASFALLSEYIIMIRSLNLKPEASIAYMQKSIPARAKFLAGQIALSKDRQKDIQKILSSDKENAEAKNQLALSQEKLDADISSLKLAISFADKLNIEMRDFQTLLVKATGEISAQTLDTEVLGVLFNEWWLQSKLAVQENTISFAIKVIVFVLIILGFKFLSSLVRRLIERSLDSRRVKASVLLKNMLASIASKIVFLMGILVALSQLGVSLAPVLAGLGVVGFIVGFALQDTLGNFAAGIMILFYRPYDVGDAVEVGGVLGKVKNMSIVNTTILTFDNQTLILPNSKIWGDVIKNITAQKSRRIDMVFGISYSDDIEKTEQILNDIVSSHEKVLNEPETVIRLHTLGESSVDFVVRPWVKTEDYWLVYWDITRAVKMRFDAEGISIPFPQRDVHLYQAQQVAT
ncbi:MAG: mechanosensitive ion channel [Gammaproteobacteria bacterium]|jgi:small conductance mechanosensitive channel